MPMSREQVNISYDVRQIVYSFLKAKDLILLVSKLNSQERRCLKEYRSDGGEEPTGYALNSSINKSKAIYKMLETSAPIRLNEVISLILPKVPLSRFCQNRYTA